MAIRIGVLGAARIAPTALIGPARTNRDVEVTAVAARNTERARQFAARQGIGVVHESYEALIADPNIDAIYNPLPNGLHGKWTIAALEAGKHVLCEKPFTANAEEAEAVAAVAKRSGKVVMEAFHYRYHALTARMLAIIASGELGRVQRIETWFCIPLFIQDIRWEWRLAGGSLMDTGCYTIHLLRTLAGAEPTVRTASVKLRAPNIDRFTEAEMSFADGRTGKITTSMASSRLLSAGARVTGLDGEMRVTNPYAPQYFHSLEVRTRKGRRKETVAKQPSSYAAQLQAFADAALRGHAFPTHADDAIANMRVIDACYAAAGLPRREPSAL
jgi:predicted dehydrogenase